ncbi:MAG TPA: acyl-CoA dehydrogenase family protein [Gaiellaceae bacterium]|nr:acyl-CoA dehydrogenase family protein [Gaiellaceae bacterium]
MPQDVRTLAREVLAPLAAAGEPGRVNRRLVGALGAHGLLEAVLPVEGTPSALELCRIREALASESPETETAFALQGLGTHPILANGRPEVVERWVPPVVRGEAVSAFALTEPAAGSDVASLSVSATRDGSAWVLSGVKKWISNAPEADVYTLFARTEPDAGSRGLTAFVVPGDAPGLRGTQLHLISPHPIGTLELDGVRVPDTHVLGEVNDGFRVAMRTLNLFRPSVGAGAVGMAQAALEAAVGHTAERQAFGKALREFQAVSHRLAEMATRLEAARRLVQAAATAYDEGAPDVPKLSAMAKLFATETAQQVIDAAVQVHGAAALEEGHLLEHLYRDVRALRIYEGASEIQREIIARELYR